MENNYNYFGIDKKKYIIDSYEYSNDELYIYARKKKVPLFFTTFFTTFLIYHTFYR